MKTNELKGGTHIEPKRMHMKNGQLVSEQPSESQDELLKSLFDCVLGIKNSKDDWKSQFTIIRNKY